MKYGRLILANLLRKKVRTALTAGSFAVALFLRWRERRSGPHLLWWELGVAVYGAGTASAARRRASAIPRRST